MTKSIVPATGLQTKPIIPLPIPLIPPLNPFCLDYFMGSITTPATALTNSLTRDFVPSARPLPKWDIFILSSCFSLEYLLPVKIDGVALAPSETRSREIMKIYERFQGAIRIKLAPLDSLLLPFILGSARAAHIIKVSLSLSISTPSSANIVDCSDFWFFFLGNMNSKELMTSPLFLSEIIPKLC